MAKYADQEEKLILKFPAEELQGLQGGIWWATS